MKNNPPKSYLSFMKHIYLRTARLVFFRYRLQGSNLAVVAGSATEVVVPVASCVLHYRLN